MLKTIPTKAVCAAAASMLLCACTSVTYSEDPMPDMYRESDDTIVTLGKRPHVLSASERHELFSAALRAWRKAYDYEVFCQTHQPCRIKILPVQSADDTLQKPFSDYFSRQIEETNLGVCYVPKTACDCPDLYLSARVDTRYYFDEQTLKTSEEFALRLELLCPDNTLVWKTTVRVKRTY